MSRNDYRKAGDNNALIVDLGSRLDPANDQIAVGLWNGAAYEAEQSNQELVLLPSGVRAATTFTPDQTNLNWRGALFILNVSAVPGVDTLTFGLEAKDLASGVYTTFFLTTTAISAIGTQKHLVYPGGNAGTGSQLTSAFQCVLPRTWRAKVVHSGAGNFTYSLGASLFR